MYHKIHDCKEEDIGVSDYNRLRIQHIWKTFGYRIKGPVHASLNYFNPLIPVYILYDQCETIKIKIISHLGY